MSDAGYSHQAGSCFFLQGAWTQRCQGLTCTLMLDQNEKNRFNYVCDSKCAEASSQLHSPNSAVFPVSCCVEDCAREVLGIAWLTVLQMRARLTVSSLHCLLWDKKHIVAHMIIPTGQRTDTQLIIRSTRNGYLDLEFCERCNAVAWISFKSKLMKSSEDASYGSASIWAGIFLLSQDKQVGINKPVFKWWIVWWRNEEKCESLLQVQFPDIPASSGPHGSCDTGPTTCFFSPEGLIPHRATSSIEH